MYDLDGLDQEARRLARAIRAKRADTRSAARAFAARLEVGGLVARLIAHDPRLPPTIWASRAGLRDLVRAYQRFDTNVGSRAQQFLNEVLEGGASATQRRTTPKRSIARPP
jgi:DNA-binding transcriptional regulator PaaX